MNNSKEVSLKGIDAMIAVLSLTAVFTFSFLSIYTAIVRNSQISAKEEALVQKLQETPIEKNLIVNWKAICILNFCMIL